MSSLGTYCPYEVVPLATCVDGVEFTVSTAFGRLRCLRVGPTKGERGTMFVHGVHDDIDSWGPLSQAAARRGIDLGPCLFVDLPGFGQSENRRGRLDLPDIADTLIDLAVGELGFSSVRLVGHSMGTLVAADIAMRHAARVDSLHLVAGPYYSIVDIMNGHLSGGLAGGFAAATFGIQYLLALTGRVGVDTVGLAARHGLLRPLLWPFVAHPRLVRQSVLDHLVADMRPASFRAAARNGFRYRKGMSWARVQCPVWAVYGAADRLVPTVDSQRLRADLPAAHLTTLVHASHLAHVEQPDRALMALGLA